MSVEGELWKEVKGPGKCEKVCWGLRKDVGMGVWCGEMWREVWESVLGFGGR